MPKIKRKQPRGKQSNEILQRAVRKIAREELLGQKPANEDTVRSSAPLGRDRKPSDT